MMPSETRILPEDEFTIIANLTTARQSWLGFGPEISAIARRQTKIPYLIRPKANAPTESRLIESNRGHVPRLRTRRERSVFHFRRIIKLYNATGDGKTARVVRTPNHGTESVLTSVESVDEIHW